jgi:hypothetical protein
MSGITKQQQLLGLTLANLKKKCKELNVPCTGKKAVLIERILSPEQHKKKKKRKRKKVSAYYSQYFTGNNHEEAELIGNFLTENHSAKIKAGNMLESDIAEDIKEHGINFYKGLNIDDPEIKTPCAIASCRFSKEKYEQFELKCKNKTCVEVDLVVIKDGVSLVELKNGCDFDTKKSKGEVQSLEATKILCEKLGYSNVSANICCYDAKELSDMKLKTTMGQVKTLLYSDLAEKCGLNGVESRNRINKKVQGRAHENREKLKNFVTSLSNFL